MGRALKNREHVLPFARFLIRHGIAVLGYDKRGVGESTGDWNTATFEDLAGDAVAAVGYLKTRRDIDASQIGLLGWSQAGWILPLAAVRAKDIAFLISISGAGVPGAETTIDQAQNEMTASRMPPQVVEQIVGLMKLQYQFARTGQGWDEYAATREKLAARMGPPPDVFPGTRDHPYWQFIKRLYFYDPAPTLRQLQVPTLALFGELDNNIVAEKNKAAWEAALKAGGNRDYTLLILPKANHDQFEAKVGSNAEMASLQRFVPGYFTTIQGWLAKRIRGFGAYSIIHNGVAQQCAAALCVAAARPPTRTSAWQNTPPASSVPVRGALARVGSRGGRRRRVLVRPRHAEFYRRLASRPRRYGPRRRADHEGRVQRS